MTLVIWSKRARKLQGTFSKPAPRVSCLLSSEDHQASLKLTLAEMHVEETDWEHEHELALLDEDLAVIGDQRRSDETKKMVNAIEVSCFHCLSMCAYVLKIPAIHQEATARTGRSRPRQAVSQDVGRCAREIPGCSQDWGKDVPGKGWQ